MIEYLDGLDYPWGHHQLLEVLIIYVLQFRVVYHEVHVEELEQWELGLSKIRKSRILWTIVCFLNIPAGGTAKTGINSAEFRT